MKIIKNIFNLIAVYIFTFLLMVLLPLGVTTITQSETLGIVTMFIVILVGVLVFVRLVAKILQSQERQRQMTV